MTATCCGKRIPGVAGAPLILACKLCPNSPTYWRHEIATGTPPAVDAPAAETAPDPGPGDAPAPPPAAPPGFAATEEGLLW